MLKHVPAHKQKTGNFDTWKKIQALKFQNDSDLDWEKFQTHLLLCFKQNSCSEKYSK